MEKTILDFVMEQTHALMAAPSCSKEAKAAAEAWLSTVGTEAEAEATQKYIAELEADIMPIDGLIGFAGLEAGAQILALSRQKFCWRMRRKLRQRAHNTAIVLPVLPARRFWIRKRNCCKRSCNEKRLAC